MLPPVYLVRHGQSEWNVLRLTQGQTAHPALTDLGRSQAVRAAHLIAADLADRGAVTSRILTSDLVRASETADILAGRLQAPVAYDARLREQHLGALQGRSYEDTWAAAADIDWTDPTIPVAGGESLMDVYERMGAVLEEMADAEGGGATVLVSHGDAIRTAIAHLHGVKPHEADWVDVPNGAVARVADRADEGVAWLSAGGHGPGSPAAGDSSVRRDG